MINLAFVDGDNVNVIVEDDDLIGDGSMTIAELGDILGVSAIENGWYDLDTKEYLGLELPEKYQ